MSHYLAYWRPSTVREILAGPRELLNHAAGNQYERVKSGDTVWIVTAWPGGRLVLLGRVPVNEVVDHPTAMRRLRVKDLWKATHHILAVPERAEPVREVDLVDMAPALRFESHRDRLDVSEGRVDGKQLQTMRQLTVKSAELLQRSWEESAHYSEVLSDLRESGLPAGGGMGSAESNRLVERGAIDHVVATLRSEGWQVESVESQRIGYDLLCRRRAEERHVEVKGVRGTIPAFIITEAELRRAQVDQRFWLYVVTEATGSTPMLKQMRGRDALKKHEFVPLAHRAVPVDGPASRQGAV
jgi:hypothetical protein